MSYYLLTNSSTLPSPLYVYLNSSGGASCGGMAAAWAVVIVIVVAAVVVVDLDLCSMKLSCLVAFVEAAVMALLVQESTIFLRSSV